MNIKHELSIKELIHSVQKELILSQEMREEKGIPALFEVEDLEIEIKFAVKKEKNKKGGIDFRLIALEAGKVSSSEEVHTLKLKLKAIPKKEDSEEFPGGSAGIYPKRGIRGVHPGPPKHIK